LLAQLIHEITNVPLAALRNCPLNEFSTPERRQWAKNRRTEEEEDIVYCLLGILSVSMPTDYGEGQESAESRLQAEPEAELEGASNTPSIIPFSRNPRFVGREAQLAELEAKLFSNEQTTTTLAIVGPGGTGKSQLALEVAHRTRQINNNYSVFWMDASDKDSLYQSYASVAQKLNVIGWDNDQADIEQLAKRCIVEISARKCLLIFDNTEHTTLQPGGWSMTEATDLADFLPQSYLCSVIFTTTNSDTAWTLASQNVIALRELTLDTALRMLQVRLLRPHSNTEQQEAEHLLEELSYLPLAVVQAAACMNASGMTVQEYCSRLDEQKKLAIGHSGDLSEDKLQSSGVKDPIAATLFISIEQIRRDDRFPTDFLFLVACVDQKDILFDLLDAASRQEREDAVKILDKYALITRRPAESALDLHRLVQQALRERLQMQGQLIQCTQRTITQLLRVFPNDNEDRLRLASKCAITLSSEGRYEEAEELFVQVMETRKRVLGDEHPDTLTSTANLASTYRRQGRWKEAEELEGQVMEMRKRVLGDEHPDTLTSMANLASTYRRQGRWKEAEELGVQAMETFKRVLGEEHPDTLTSMHNLASTLQSQARHREAFALMERCSQLREQVLGAQHPDAQSLLEALSDWRAKWE
jgi:tetratricopeptide (TPR) repeat protein